MRSLLIIHLFFLAAGVEAQPGIWTWLHGDTADSLIPIYGTEGVSDPSSHPVGTYEGVEWLDKLGRFWYMPAVTTDSTGNYGVKV